MQKIRLGSSSLFIFSLCIILAGCKEDDSPTGVSGGKPEIVSFTANPITVPAGGDSVTLSWQVNKADSITINPAIGKVTPVSSGSKKVFVSGPTTFTIKATNAAGSIEATASITAAASITLNGYVKDADNEPMSGVTVIVKGKNPVITESGGLFTIPDVATPYEIRMILSTQQTVVIYQGLTKPNPVLIYPNSTTQQKSAVINGIVPAAIGKTTFVFFVSGDKCWSTQANANGNYTINLTWKGSAASYTGKVQVLRWTSNTSGLPSAYDAYGSKNLTVSSSGTFNNIDFASTDFTDPAEQSITGTISLPGTNYNLAGKGLGLNIGNALIFLASESGANLTTNFSYSVPTISGFTYTILGFALANANPTSRISQCLKTGIAAGTTGVTIPLELAPQLNLPAHSGTSIDTTTQFLWAQGSGTGVNEIVVQPSNVGPTFYIYTTSNSTTIPNLAPQGLGLPVNASYRWEVMRFCPLNSVDDLASETYMQFRTGHLGDLSAASSEVFNFTTH